MSSCNYLSVVSNKNFIVDFYVRGVPKNPGVLEPPPVREVSWKTPLPTSCLIELAVGQTFEYMFKAETYGKNLYPRTFYTPRVKRLR